MWKLRSLAYSTDLFLAGVAGEVRFRDRYVVVRTPANPDFWWGNFLLYPEPPAEDSCAVWLADHARELSDVPVKLFAWDRPDGARGAVEGFLGQGFEVDESSILTAESHQVVKPRRWNDDVRVARLSSDDDWAAAARAQTNAFAPRRSGTLDELRRFVDRQHESFRRMQKASIGQWWGAWIGDELAGSLGLVRVSRAPDDAREPETLGRFQLIGVDPRYGGQGVCSRMLHDVATDAFEAHRFDRLVVAADASYHAVRVYQGVGFRPTEQLLAVVEKPCEV